MDCEKQKYIEELLISFQVKIGTMKILNNKHTIISEKERKNEYIQYILNQHLM